MFFTYRVNKRFPNRGMLLMNRLKSFLRTPSHFSLLPASVKLMEAMETQSDWDTLPQGLPVKILDVISVKDIERRLPDLRAKAPAVLRAARRSDAERIPGDQAKLSELEGLVNGYALTGANKLLEQIRVLTPDMNRTALDHLVGVARETILTYAWFTVVDRHCPPLEATLTLIRHGFQVTALDWGHTSITATVLVGHLPPEHRR